MRSYDVDPRIGSNQELLELKHKLNSLGMGLVLDYVPNHLAKDHPWVREHPDYFISANRNSHAFDEHPEWFFESDGNYLAHGRDPYFAPWTDTAQLNVLNHKTRLAMVRDLKKIAGVCDGIRCDMAMLLLNDVFRGTWGACLTNQPDKEEFWQQAIQKVLEKNPQFLFIAEVYWDLEVQLQALGFDFTYNKVLYDRLLRSGSESVAKHIAEKEVFADRFVSFIENHDEPRAASSFGREKSLAAAAVIATLPGMRLFHDGQAEGRKKKLPIQMSREPQEDVDTETLEFYEKLYAYADQPLFHEGVWKILESRPAFEKSDSQSAILAWIWFTEHDWRLTAINYSPHSAQAKFRIPEFLLRSDKIYLTDVLTNETYERYADELADDGLYIALNPWQSHLFVTQNG